MAQMVDAWGGIFHVKVTPQLMDAKGNRALIALRILSNISDVLQESGGLSITKPKGSGREAAKVQCILEKRLGFDLYVSAQEIANDGSTVFQLSAFGYMGKDDDMSEAARVDLAWGQIQPLMEQVVTKLGFSQITWLTAEERDARAHQELLRR
ncbi:hypothetical protein [Bryobacter aggregatus]|uniref:hypothetical protein n=1 Tax=Bryobacter aggregatus TaxID=360054 RepID=UPI0004E180E0|nr:hypothetical protein [Bryobacter aggregatus]